MTLESTQIKQKFSCDECGTERHHGNLVGNAPAQTPTKFRLVKVTVLEFPNRESFWEFHLCEKCWPAWKERLDG